MKYIYIVLGVALFICLIPFFSPFAAIAVAQLAGCDLDEGGTHMCMIAGQDWGDALYTAFVFGWLALATLPFAALILLALVVTGIVDFFRRRIRRTKRAQ